ncbi:hypothetical protein K466DRAFT_507111, partial [Polyporus arcularius HHB13444]
DAMYDAAFQVNAMSDDEDEYPDGQVPAGKPTRYCSRVPDWRSQQLQDVYTAVDARPDTKPDRAAQMRERFHGEPKTNAKPPKAKVLKNRVRVWMIRPELLEDGKNADWLEERRVARNGIAWGDAEDPVEEEPAKRKESTQGGRKVKHVRVDTSGVDAARVRVSEITNGIDPELIFMQL